MEHLGVKFPDEGKLLAENLLDWEAGLPEIESAVEIHLRALKGGKNSLLFGLTDVRIVL